MNGKIKTKFAALFAVALMITVCVVPMVGNDYGADGLDAVYTPDVDSEDYVTITGKVYNAAGSAWTAGGKVVASYDGASGYSADIKSNGTYEIVVYGGADKIIKVNVDQITPDFDGDANPAIGYGFNEVTITNAVGGQKYVADFATGKKMVSGTIEFANDKAITSDLFSGTFAVTVGNGTSSVNATVILNKNGLRFSALISSSWDSSKLKVTLDTPEGCAIGDITDAVDWNGQADIKVKESLGTATASESLKAYGLTIDTSAVSSEDGDSISKIVMISKAIDSDSVAYYAYILAGQNQKFTFSTTEIGDVVVSAGESVTLSPSDKVLYGSVKMGSVFAGNGTALRISYKYDGQAESVDGTKEVTTRNGYYVTKVDNKVLSITGVVFTNSAFKSDSTSNSGGQLNVTVKSEGFTYIKGIVSYNGTGQEFAGLSLASGSFSNVFGVDSASGSYPVDVTSNGYGFYAKKGAAVTLTATGCTPAQTTVVPGSDTVIQNFTIAPQEITFQANDASGNQIESSDIDAYYAYVTEGGNAFKTATYTKVDLVDGEATVKINGQWDLTKLYVYYDGGNTGYTFAVGSKDTARPYMVSEEGEESTYPGQEQDAKQILATFTVTGSSATADLTGVKVKFGEYKIITIAEKKYAYELVKNVKEVSVANGEVSLLLEMDKIEAGNYIAEVIVPSTSKEIFKNPYYITYNPTEKTYTSEFKAVSSTDLINGTVTTDNDVPLAGMEVSIVDADDKVVGTAVTDMLGEFYVNYEKPAVAGVLSVIVKDKAGIYTFDEVDAYAVNDDDEPIAPAVESKQSLVTGTVEKDDKIILDSETISAAVYDADGKKLQEVKVGADGKFKVAYKTNDEIVVTDSSKVQTFTVTIDESDYTAVATSNLTTVVYTVYDVESISERVLVKGAEVVMVNNSTGALIGDKVVTGKDGKATFTYDKSLGEFTVKALASAGEYNEASANEHKNIYLGVPLVKYTLADAADKNSDRFEGFKIVKYMKDANNVYQAAKEYTADEKGQFKAFGNDPEFLITGEGYTFGSVNTDDGRVTAVSGTLKANEKDLFVSVMDKNGEFGIPGVTVEIFNKNDKVILTGVTDLEGKYKFIAKSDVKALAKSGETDYGTFKFSDEKTAVSDVIKADKNVYSGTYAEGKVIDGVSVTYEIMRGTSLVEAGNASIVEDKYYIATDNTGTSVKITATANLFYAQVTGTLGDMNLMVQYVKPVSVEVKQAVYGVQVLGADNAVIGSVITLIAPNEYSETINAAENVVQKYKFAGWYVNGEKVSDSNITTYTIKGECNVYADYEISTYETGVVADESNGLSMDVLILGIVIVVLGLLAFAYAVKFKKE